MCFGESTHGGTHQSTYYGYPVDANVSCWALRRRAVKALKLYVKLINRPCLLSPTVTCARGTGWPVLEPSFSTAPPAVSKLPENEHTQFRHHLFSEQ